MPLKWNKPDSLLPTYLKSGPVPYPQVPCEAAGLTYEPDENYFYDVTPPEEFYRSATFSYRNRRHLNGTGR